METDNIPSNVEAVIMNRTWEAQFLQGYHDARQGVLIKWTGSRAYQAGVAKWRLEMKAALRASEAWERRQG